jgi:restriction system protein
VHYATLHFCTKQRTLFGHLNLALGFEREIEKRTMIWKYQDRARVISKTVISADKCIYCKQTLDALPDIYETDANHTDRFMGGGYEVAMEVYACPCCGWWKLVRVLVFEEFDDDPDSFTQERGHIFYACMGSLLELDISDIRTPIEEVRRFLSARYTSRFNLHPRLLEETVASVFEGMGYRVRLTGYTRDNGIDAILDGPEDSLIGVQVKRYKNRISVEQIRSFAGALLLGGYTEGIFVTTSGYTKPAYAASQLAESRGIPIQLLNAQKFYDALSLGQRNMYISKQDKHAPFLGISSREMTLLKL